MFFCKICSENREIGAAYDRMSKMGLALESHKNGMKYMKQVTYYYVKFY